MLSNTRTAVEDRRKARNRRLEDELARMLPLMRSSPEVRRVLLFGSLARGESGTRSDLDLVIVQETAKRFMDRLDEWYAKLTPGVETDLLVYTPEEWEMLTRTRSFVRRLSGEARVLYDAATE